MAKKEKCIGHRKVEELFDKQAEAVYQCQAFSDREKIWKILNYAGLKAGYRVIDIGCGPGHILREVQGYVQEIVGLDISPRMLQVAGQQAPKAKLVHGVAEDLPFADESFDMVLSRAAIHHVQDVRAAFKEMARICKSSGYVVIAETLTSPDKQAADLHNYLEKLRDPSHHRMLTLKDYYRLFADTGLCRLGKLRTEDERELGEWLDVTSPSSEARAEIRRILEENIENDRTGLRPYKNSESIRFRHIGTTFKALKKGAVPE